MLAINYPVEDFNTSWQKSLVTSSTLIGMIIGMILLGALSDRYGRRELMLMTSTVSFVGSLIATCAWDDPDDVDSIWNVIIGGRLLLGIGIGGELPLCASHAAEASAFDESGFQLALVLCWEGVGLVVALLVSYFCQLAVCVLPNECQFTGGYSPQLEFVWRFVFGGGAFLSLVGMVTRYFLLHNTQTYERGGRKQCSLGETMAVAREYWRPLTSTCLGWAIYGAQSYGVGMYAPDIIVRLKPSSLLQVRDLPRSPLPKVLQALVTPSLTRSPHAALPPSAHRRRDHRGVALAPRLPHRLLHPTNRPQARPVRWGALPGRVLCPPVRPRRDGQHDGRAHPLHPPDALRVGRPNDRILLHRRRDLPHREARNAPRHLMCRRQAWRNDLRHVIPSAPRSDRSPLALWALFDHVRQPVSILRPLSDCPSIHCPLLSSPCMRCPLLSSPCMRCPLLSPPCMRCPLLSPPCLLTMRATDRERARQVPRRPLHLRHMHPLVQLEDARAPRGGGVQGEGDHAPLRARALLCREACRGGVARRERRRHGRAHERHRHDRGRQERKGLTTRRQCGVEDVGTCKQWRGAARESRLP